MQILWFSLILFTLLPNIVTAIIPTCPDPSPQRVQVRCAQFSFHHKYRTYDGSCNNLGNPHWGKARTPLLRLLPPRYDDAGTIDFGNSNGGGRGLKMPNPRKVSQIIMSAKGSANIHDDMRHTAMLAHWGQFLAHDLSLSKESESNCSRLPVDPDTCLNIGMPQDEKTLPLGGIFPFKRTESCRDGGLREQLNVLTSYIDASQVYGSNQLAALRIRDRFPVDHGKLRENLAYRSPGGKGYMVFDISEEMACHRNKSKVDGMRCFLAGDPRANEQLMLTSIHTVMLREHNRIAQELRKLNPEWDGETVFHETRKIVGALIQHISFKEWLPKILGRGGFQMIGPYEGYDPVVNAGVANGIAAAAMRFGHTMVVSSLKRLDKNFQPDSIKPEIQLRDAFFAPENLIRYGGIDSMLRGSIASPVKDISPDGLVSGELTNHLFPNAHIFPLDLAAMNIQRGRDHALPPYNEWRSLCGLARINSWGQMRAEVRDARVVDEVAELYGEPENLDVWVGGLLEKPIRGGKIGRTFSCLLADQFKRLRRGDRHWFENPGVFGLHQLQTIREYSLSKLLCNNLDEESWMPKDSFVFYPSLLRQFVRCSELPDLNLTLWRIDENGFAGSFECSSPDCTCRYQLGSWGECQIEEGVDIPVQKRHDLLVTGKYPPCTAQRVVKRRCFIPTSLNVDSGSLGDGNVRTLDPSPGSRFRSQNRQRFGNLQEGFPGSAFRPREPRRRKHGFFAEFAKR